MLILVNAIDGTVIIPVTLDALHVKRCIAIHVVLILYGARQRNERYGIKNKGIESTRKSTRSPQRGYAEKVCQLYFDV